jgi:hypothetical protein
MDYVFDTEDPTTYIYHFFAHVASFWSHSIVYWVAVGSLARDPGNSAALRVFPDLADSVGDGDVLIVSPYLEQQTTATVPARVAPLIVERVRITTFRRDAQGDYLSADGGRMAVQTTGGMSVILHGNSIQDHHYEVYSLPSGAFAKSLGDLDVQGGSAQLAVPSTAWPAGQQVTEILLLNYEFPMAFPQPDYQQR